MGGIGDIYLEGDEDLKSISWPGTESLPQREGFEIKSRQGYEGRQPARIRNKANGHDMMYHTRRMSEEKNWQGR